MGVADMAVTTSVSLEEAYFRRSGYPPPRCQCPEVGVPCPQCQQSGHQKRVRDLPMISAVSVRRDGATSRPARWAFLPSRAVIVDVIAELEAELATLQAAPRTSLCEERARLARITRVRRQLRHRRASLKKAEIAEGQ
jgi:hypothetical protein